MQLSTKSLNLNFLVLVTLDGKKELIVLTYRIISNVKSCNTKQIAINTYTLGTMANFRKVSCPSLLGDQIT